MAINKLNDIINKKSLEFVKKLLSEEVITITEKLDTYRFMFEQKNGNLTFYNKDNKEINLVSRTLCDIYEDPINELSKIIKESHLTLPNNTRFGIAYTPIDRPLRIPYTKLPKYVLTDIIEKTNNNVSKIYDIDELNEWSSKLCIAKPPIIFKGKLNETQINTLIQYSQNNYDNLNYDNFSNLIESLFGKTYSKENILEGIILSSKNMLSQIISYEFDILNEAYEKQMTSPRDFYDLIIINLNTFMDNYSLPIFEQESNKEQQYINIVCDIFNKFHSKCKNEKILESFDPEFINSPSFGFNGKINIDFIKDKKTIELILESKINENLFKVLLSSLRKTKKPYGLLNESIIDKFNTYVHLINHITDNKLNEELEVTNYNNLNESEDNIVIDNIKKKKLTDIDNMRVIASIQKSFDPIAEEVTKGKQKCVIYFTNLKPFTNEQLSNINTIYQNFNVPIIIASMSSKRKIKSNEFIFTDEVIKMQMKALNLSHHDKICAYLLTDSFNLYELFEYARPEFEPIALITDMNKKADFVLQLYFNEEVMGKKINVEKEFNIGEMDVKDSLMAFRAIEDNNMVLFKEKTPECIWSFYDIMKEEYKTYNGLKMI